MIARLMRSRASRIACPLPNRHRLGSGCSGSRDTAVVVSLDKGLDLGLQRHRQVVILQQNAVFHGLVPALDLALRLWVGRRSTDMLDTVLRQPLGEGVRDEPRLVVREQSQALAQRHIAAALGGHGQF
jgi:hypothetical protein